MGEFAFPTDPSRPDEPVHCAAPDPSQLMHPSDVTELDEMDSIQGLGYIVQHETIMVIQTEHNFWTSATGNPLNACKYNDEMLGMTRNRKKV